MKLVVVGAGYVGLVTGACLSGTGNHVTIVDVDRDRTERLKRGELPIYEPGLADIIRYNSDEGRLSFTTDLASSLKGAQAVFLAVGTPAGFDGSVDMRAMDAAASQIADAMTDYLVVITKSTVPVGTWKRISGILSARTQVAFDYVSNPEFLKEGNAVDDFLKPDRVIVGPTSDRALSVMRHLYAPFMRRSDRMLVMDPTSAELTKYACNAMLATRISFVNEIARLCETVGADIEMIRRGMGSDHRIGPEFLFPSLGYGGSCFPKDVKALISMGRVSNCPMGLVEAVDMVNRDQCETMFQRIRHHFGGRLVDKKFAVWGLAFKARTDDVRESPAIALIQRLVGAGAKVAAHDPKAIANAQTLLGNGSVEYCADMYAALAGASALVICTEWQEYRTPDFDLIRSTLAKPVIFDGRNLYEVEWMASTGLTYISIGRPTVSAAAPPEGRPA